MTVSKRNNERERCGVCRKRKFGELDAFAGFNGGGQLANGRQRDGERRELKGFLHLYWQGRQGENGIGGFPEVSASHLIADDAESGQFEIRFCSISCMKRYFNSCIDALERNVRQRKLEIARRRA